MAKTNIADVVGQLLAERAKAQAQVEAYDREIEEARKLLGGLVSNGLRKAPKTPGPKVKRSRGAVPQADTIAAMMRQMGATSTDGIRVSELAQKLGADVEQVKAKLHGEMKEAGTVTSNGIRGIGGRWFLGKAKASGKRKAKGKGKGKP